MVQTSQAPLVTWLSSLASRMVTRVGRAFSDWVLTVELPAMRALEYSATSVAAGSRRNLMMRLSNCPMRSCTHAAGMCSTRGLNTGAIASTPSIAVTVDLWVASSLTESLLRMTRHPCPQWADTEAQTFTWVCHRLTVQVLHGVLGDIAPPPSADTSRIIAEQPTPRP